MLQVLAAYSAANIIANLQAAVAAAFLLLH
jgi:hypothetical protein